MSIIFGLDKEVDYFDQALELILYNEYPRDKSVDLEDLNQAAEIAYAIIH